MAASDRIIWHNPTTGHVRIDDYDAKTVRSLVAGPSLSDEEVRLWVIAENKRKSPVHVGYEAVAVVPVADLPWEGGDNVHHQYFNLRDGLRWDGHRIVIDASAAKAALRENVKKAAAASLAECQEQTLRMLTGELSKEEEKSLKAYRKALIDLPDTVAAEVAGLDVDGLKAYRIEWPKLSK